MESQNLISKQWITFGAVSGIISNILFPILLLVELPDYIQVFLASIFGILFALSGFAIHHLLKFEKATILTLLGTLFIFCAGVVFNLMLMVQLTFKGYLQNFQKGIINQVDADMLYWITKTVDPVHLGMQLSSDFFTAFGMIFFSMVMLKSKYFGKVWGMLGILIGTSLVIVKCYAFPMTPYEVGIPYILGPLIAIWFLFVSIKCVISIKKIK